MKRTINKLLIFSILCNFLFTYSFAVRADAETWINGNIAASSIDVSASSTANYIIEGETLTSDSVEIINNSNFPISIGVAEVEKTIGTIKDVLPEEVGSQAQWFQLGRKDSNSKIALGLKHSSGDYLEEYLSDILYFRSVQDSDNSIGLGALASNAYIEYQIDGFYGLAFDTEINEQYKVIWDIGLYEGSTGGEVEIPTPEPEPIVSVYDFDYDVKDIKSNNPDYTQRTLLKYTTVKPINKDYTDENGIYIDGGDIEIVSLHSSSRTLDIPQYIIYTSTAGSYDDYVYKVVGIQNGITLENQGLLETANIKYITTIPASAFKNCIKLQTVNISDSVTEIKGLAFSGCDSLTEITIPSSVTSIASNVFNGCTNLTTIYYSGTATGAPWGATNATVISE